MQSANCSYPVPREQTAPPDIVTISIGISTNVPSEQGSAEEFFKQADTALYEAKSLGRNQYFEHT